MVTSHSVTLTGLSASTTYYFRVGSTDGSGNGPTTSAESSFNTDAIPDTTAPMISNIQVTSTTDTIAVIEWATDEHSNSQVQYGTSSNTWGNYPSSKNDSAMVTNHSVTLTGLSASTTYYFRVGSTDMSSNGPTISGEMGFTTNHAPDTDSPSIVQYPTINYTNKTIDITYNESNIQNATIEQNYTFSPSLLFGTLGGSDDITHLGSNTYRLSMAFLPSDTIFTITVNNITDAAGNPATPNSIKINDNDNDDMPDDWESTEGVSDPNGDPDGDGLNNLEEYDNNTSPNNSDTDGDGLPDGWEVTYGLDPNDSTGSNGGDGDFDADNWTNYEEYTNSYDPADNNSPGPIPPEISKTIPRDGVGIVNATRIPQNTSFAVLFEDHDGIDITDTSSMMFTINDGVNPVYERDLSHTTSVRVVKLTSDADTQVTKLWAVYDRSTDDQYDYSYALGTVINIKVDVKDREGVWMAQASFEFKIESEEERDDAYATRPITEESTTANLTTLTVVSNDSLNGLRLVFDKNEPITPYVRSSYEIPPVNFSGITPVGYPASFGPPTVFNNPVRVTMPIPNWEQQGGLIDDLIRDLWGDEDKSDVGDLNLYVFDGFEWVYASSSYNTGGVIQPGGEGWMVPGSLVAHNDTTPPTLEVQVHHFSAIQTGATEGDSDALGCFITAATVGSEMEWLLNPIALLLAFILPILTAVCLTKMGTSVKK
jgi:hypothetical protein